MPPIPGHPAPWGTPSVATWAKLIMPVLQTKRYRFWLELWPTGPEVVLDIFLYRSTWAILPPRGLTLSPRNSVRIPAAVPELWGLMTFK